MPRCLLAPENSTWLSSTSFKTSLSMGSVKPPLNARPSQLATLAALATLFTTRCLADGETKNYINTIPGYSQLVPCAEHPLSTIVRGMSQGCGENWTAITSYTCFCTRSSSYMSSAISKDVSSYCRNSSALEQVSSAIAVWDAYCDLGVEAGLTVDPLPSELLYFGFLCNAYWSVDELLMFGSFRQHDINCHPNRKLSDGLTDRGGR